MTEPAHLTICFRPDGRADFFPEGDADELARRLGRLVLIFAEHPEAVRCAAGACGGTCGHTAMVNA